ncbi:hypothetical protein V4S29_08695 [Enterococcus cecorum]|uniref:hypothetical protein n=1 Tax=Enterococcus cecorum TaxID=44008 RepID=UPI003264B895
MNFYFVTIHYKSRISEDFGDFQYTSLLGAYEENNKDKESKEKTEKENKDENANQEDSEQEEKNEDKKTD